MWAHAIHGRIDRRWIPAPFSKIRKYSKMLLYVRLSVTRLNCVLQLAKEPFGKQENIWRLFEVFAQNKGPSVQNSASSKLLWFSSLLRINFIVVQYALFYRFLLYRLHLLEPTNHSCRRYKYIIRKVRQWSVKVYRPVNCNYICSSRHFGRENIANSIVPNDGQAIFQFSNVDDIERCWWQVEHQKIFRINFFQLTF